MYPLFLQFIAVCVLVLLALLFVSSLADSVKRSGWLRGIFGHSVVIYFAFLLLATLAPVLLTKYLGDRVTAWYFGILLLAILGANIYLSRTARREQHAQAKRREV